MQRVWEDLQVVFKFGSAYEKPYQRLAWGLTVGEWVPSTPAGEPLIMGSMGKTFTKGLALSIFKSGADSEDSETQGIPFLTCWGV